MLILMRKKIFLLDAMALIYRSYFAFANNQMINSKGLNTSTMLGFTNTLFDVIRKNRPTHIAVVFDTHVPTHRHEEFEDYKANREAMPEDIREALPYIDAILEAFNIPKLFVDGYEADDVIGTLAKKAEKRDFETYMMTPDKDFAQLVSENIFMYKPARKGNQHEIWGVEEVKEKFEVERPEQVIDILGLWGDAVDNIPGIPGIGEKRAKELVGLYGSVEGIIQNVDKLKGKMKENVMTFAQQGLDSKRLATITLDVPIDFDEDLMKYQSPDYDKLKLLFDELEFRTLAKRIFTELSLKDVEAKKTENSTIDMFAQLDSQQEGVSGLTTLKVLEEINHDYKIVSKEHEISRLINDISTQKEVAIHIITTNSNPHQAEMAGIAFLWEKTKAFYLPVPESYNEVITFLEKFKSIFSNKNICLIAYDHKYIVSVLKWYKIDVENQLFDIMLAHYLIEPDMKHELKILAENILEFKVMDSDYLIGRKSEAAKRLKGRKINFRDVKSDLVCEYAGQKLEVVFRLKPMLLERLKETNTLELYNNVEIPLLKVLAAIETHGIRLNTHVLAEYSDLLSKKINSIEEEIYSMAKHKFNISSPKQLGIILFEELKVSEKPKMTKTKQYKTGEEILIKLKDKHPIINLIMEYRTLTKLKSTYVDALPLLVNPRTKHIHTSYNQAVASTGRLSSKDPNLQNIPIRTDEGREIRKAFVPYDDNYVLMAADYSQIELRIITHLSKDEKMMEDFLSGKDIHTATAARVYGVKIEDVSPDMRRNAKSVNFGIIYGISAFGLAENLGISRVEAKNIIDSYFNQYYGFKEFIEKQIIEAKENKYVETILKRRRYLRDINSSNAMVRAIAERNAVNAPIQGSSADMIKIAMINIYQEMKKRAMKSKMILQVHDELVFDAHKDEVDELMILVKELMMDAMPLDVPLVVDAKTGLNWLEAH